jgi:hypothetical protein
LPPHREGSRLRQGVKVATREGVEVVVLWLLTHLAGNESRTCWGVLKAPPGIELAAELRERLGVAAVLRRLELAAAAKGEGEMGVGGCGGEGVIYL